MLYAKTNTINIGDNFGWLLSIVSPTYCFCIWAIDRRRRGRRKECISQIPSKRIEIAHRYKDNTSGMESGLFVSSSSASSTTFAILFFFRVISRNYFNAKCLMENKERAEKGNFNSPNQSLFSLIAGIQIYRVNKEDIRAEAEKYFR
jgi:hypothetical protein